MDVYVNAAKLEEDLSDVILLGMDETSVAKGHDYITPFVDIEKRKMTATQKMIKTNLSLAKLNLKSVRVMRMRELFQQIYAAHNLEIFEDLLNKWYYWTTHCQLVPMVKAAKTIKNHWQGILRWKESQIDNGILEGLNSVLQAAKRKARGYKKPHFKIIAYLLTGKLDFSKVYGNCRPD